MTLFAILALYSEIFFYRKRSSRRIENRKLSLSSLFNVRQIFSQFQLQTINNKHFSSRLRNPNILPDKSEHQTFWREDDGWDSDTIRIQITHTIPNENEHRLEEHFSRERSTKKHDAVRHWISWILKAFISTFLHSIYHMFNTLPVLGGIIHRSHQREGRKFSEISFYQFCNSSSHSELICQSSDSSAPSDPLTQDLHQKTIVPQHSCSQYLQFLNLHANFMNTI